MINNLDVNYLGFHGTIQKYAKVIMESGTFKTDLRKDHWLGQGIYFFREDYAQALWWAGNTKKKVLRRGFMPKKDVKPAVIACRIVIDPKHVMNLDTNTGKDVFSDFYDQNKKTLDEIKWNDSMSEHERRCAVIDMIPIDKIKVVQYTFPKDGEYDYKIDSIFRKLGIQQCGVQICVRDESLVTSDNIQEIKPAATTPQRLGYASYSNSGVRSNGGKIVFPKEDRTPTNR